MLDNQNLRNNDNGNNHPNNLVVDLGTSSIKAGWSRKGEPEVTIPSVVGRGRHSGAMLNLGLKDRYVGRQAQNLRGILSLHQPIQSGLIQNWDDMNVLWDFLWDRFQSQAYNLDDDGIKVLLSVAPNCPTSDREKLAEMVLETEGVTGVYLANKSVLAMYGGGRTTGICVDSGEDSTFIVPCWEGNPIPGATLIQPVGGRHVTDRLLKQLSNGKYSFTDDTFLIWRRGSRPHGPNNKKRLSVASRRDVVREAKERFCRVTAKAGYIPDDFEEKVLRLPDGNIVVVGHEAFSAPEILFDVSDSTSLHDLVHSSVLRCDEKLRPRLLSNIMLSGGNTMIPGMDERLRRELSALLPDNVKVKVQAQPGRDRFSWDGGAHLCGLSSFQELWLTKADYAENGAAKINTELDNSNGSSPSK